MNKTHPTKEERLTALNERSQLLHARLHKLRFLLECFKKGQEVDIHIFPFDNPNEGLFLRGQPTSAVIKLSEEKVLGAIQADNHLFSEEVILLLIRRYERYLVSIDKLIEEVNNQFQ